MSFVRSVIASSSALLSPIETTSRLSSTLIFFGTRAKCFTTTTTADVQICGKILATTSIKKKSDHSTVTGCRNKSEASGLGRSRRSALSRERLIGGAVKMSTLPEAVRAKLDQIADVKIDESGKFKYILIKVYAKDKDGKDSDENSKLVVRGRADCLYHGDIFDKFQEETARIEGIDDDILGGGRMERTGNKIFVYGYSQGYGKADHALTVEILKKKYPSHEITWSDEGY